jgi:hypothetical protein
MAVIQPYVMHVVSQHYKALTYFKVGAIRLRGVNSQYDLMGGLHCDYHDDVNKKVPGERPQSILMGLDPFKLLYESGCIEYSWLEGLLIEPLVTGWNPSCARVVAEPLVRGSNPLNAGVFLRSSELRCHMSNQGTTCGRYSGRHERQRLIKNIFEH